MIWVAWAVGILCAGLAVAVNVAVYRRTKRLVAGVADATAGPRTCDPVAGPYRTPATPTPPPAEPEFTVDPKLVALKLAYADALAQSNKSLREFHNARGAVADLWWNRYRSASDRAQGAAAGLAKMGYDVLTEGGGE